MVKPSQDLLHYWKVDPFRKSQSRYFIPWWTEKIEVWYGESSGLIQSPERQARWETRTDLRNFNQRSSLKSKCLIRGTCRRLSALAIKGSQRNLVKSTIQEPSGVTLLKSRCVFKVHRCPRHLVFDHMATISGCINFNNYFLLYILILVPP